MGVNPLRDILNFATREARKVESSRSRALTLPKFAPLLSQIANRIPDLPIGETGKTAMITDIRKMPANLHPIPGLITRIGQEAQTTAEQVAKKEQPPELPPEIIEANPEGLRTQVPGMSAYTTQHLTQGVDMQGARGSL